MPLKPEVNTSPFGALLLVIVIVAIIAGALVLPAILPVLLWAVLIFAGALVVYYLGQRLHRRLLGAGGGH